MSRAPSPLLGRTYVVEMKESRPIFTDGRGAPVSDEERKELGRREGNIGKPDPFLDGIPEGPLLPGRSAAAMAGGFLEILEETGEGTRDGPDLANVDIHFAGARDSKQGRCGVFAFGMKVDMPGEPRLQMDLKGEFSVRISDGAPIELDLRGPVRLTGTEVIEGVNVRMTGTGQMQGGFRIDYP